MTYEERLRAMMAAPLGSVADVDRGVRPPITVVERWDLPKKDRLALVEWGLPTDLVMTPEIQNEPEPQLTPNVAGEQERRLIAEDRRLYRLGRWGRHDLSMGAVAGDGRVLGIRKAPVTAADLHPDLREVYANLYHPLLTPRRGPHRPFQPDRSVRANRPRRSGDDRSGDQPR